MDYFYRYLNSKFYRKIMNRCEVFSGDLINFQMLYIEFVLEITFNCRFIAIPIWIVFIIYLSIAWHKQNGAKCIQIWGYFQRFFNFLKFSRFRCFYFHVRQFLIMTIMIFYLFGEKVTFLIVEDGSIACWWLPEGCMHPLLYWRKYATATIDPGLTLSFIFPVELFNLRFVGRIRYL